MNEISALDNFSLKSSFADIDNRKKSTEGAILALQDNVRLIIEHEFDRTIRRMPELEEEMRCEIYQILADVVDTILKIPITQVSIGSHTCTEPSLVETFIKTFGLFSECEIPV